MKIEVFEIASKEDRVYQELLEQYKTNPEVQELLNEFIIPTEIVWAGDFSLNKMLKYAIDVDDIKVYLVKDVDNDIFVWVIGKFVNDGKIMMFPLLKEQSKELQLEIRSALVEKGLIAVKLKENNFSLEDLEVTDWDPAEDFESVEEMRGFLELEFLENNVEFMLDAINTVARAKGLNQIAQQADSLQGKNPSREVINQMLNNIGFLWDNKKMIILE